MRHGDAAWVTLAVGIAAYELAAPADELLSQAVDRYRRAHPAITVALICYVAAHLLRIIPPRWDPLHRLAVRLKR